MIFKRFKEAFDQLPPVTDLSGKQFEPVFDFGTEDDLKKRLTSNRRTNPPFKFYPIIWLVTPIEEAESVSATFILATMNKKTEMGNWDRLHWSFDSILEPLLTNVMKAVKQSRTFKFDPDGWDKNYRGTKYFDYHIQPDIWDAIEVEFVLRYNRECKVKTKMNF